MSELVHKRSQTDRSLIAKPGNKVSVKNVDVDTPSSARWRLRYVLSVHNLNQ